MQYGGRNNKESVGGGIMQEIQGDILNVTSGIICHQVNCRGVMGAGLALAIRNKWPLVANDYFAQFNTTGIHLGDVVLSHVDKANNLYVASLAGQDQFGKGIVFTNYNAVKTCLAKLNYWNARRFQVYIPTGMSCGLAGGDWYEILRIITMVMPNAILIDKQVGGNHV